MLGVMVSSLAGAEQKRQLLNRSIYMPVEFRLCEHLDSAIFYENDLPTSTMPAKRIFQFTYYPDLGGDVLRFLSKKNDVWFPKLKPVPVMGTEKENHTSWERYYRVSDCSSSSRNNWYLGR